jgi:lipopolysaccharide export LptBFGC system permease protein LptF
MSCFCFVLLGIGVATVRTRGKQINPFLLSFLTVLGYWQLQVSTLYWANGGVMPAFVALQIPNILMLIFGAWFYRRACW